MTDKRRTPGAIARFFSVLTDSLWELVQLNFIFLLTSLPLVTFGAALTALDSCFLDILRKKRRVPPKGFFPGTIAQGILQTFLNRLP